VVKEIIRTGYALSPLRQFFFQQGHLNVPNLPEYEALFDLCNRLRASRRQLPAPVVEELNAFGFRWELMQSNELRWYYHYYELKKYYEEFGHTRVPAKKGDHRALGAWVLRQRNKEASLSVEKKRLLKKIHFQWSDDIVDAKKDYWLGMFKKLKAFYDQYGHANVPDRYKANEVLGRWVSTVRYTKDLESWKLKLLKTVNFKFSDDIREDKSKSRQKDFKKLEAFYKKHGHANVPEGFSDYRLSIFVAYLRQYPERISAAEKKQLKKWDFLFSEDIKKHREGQWQKFFDKLKRFKEKYGHCRVSSAFPDRPLANWVGKQRKLKKFKKLHADREKLLKAVGFYFYDDIEQLQEKKWQKRYQELLDFKKKYGTTVVQESFGNKQLVYWVLHQRQLYKRMPAKRKKMLNSIGFVWKVKK
jgi:hypothetical protein